MRLSSAAQLTRAVALTVVAAVREQVTTHSATVDATPGEVWELMSSPALWPSFDVRVARVEGQPPLGHGSAHLMAIGRLLGLRVPVDVEDVRYGQSLTVTARLLPGLSEIAEHQIVPVASGGTQIVSRVRAAGPLGALGAVPTWLSAELVVRLLARQAERQRPDSPRATASASTAST